LLSAARRGAGAHRLARDRHKGESE